MCSGYLSQINFMLSSVQKNIDVLEAKLVDGEKAEQVLEPLISALDKSMSQYQIGIGKAKPTAKPAAAAP